MHIRKMRFLKRSLYVLCIGKAWSFLWHALRIHAKYHFLVWTHVHQWLGLQVVSISCTFFPCLKFDASLSTWGIAVSNNFGWVDCPAISLKAIHPPSQPCLTLTSVYLWLCLNQRELKLKSSICSWMTQPLAKTGNVMNRTVGQICLCLNRWRHKQFNDESTPDSSYVAELPMAVVSARIPPSGISQILQASYLAAHSVVPLDLVQALNPACQRTS